MNIKKYIFFIIGMVLGGVLSSSLVFACDLDNPSACTQEELASIMNNLILQTGSYNPYNSNTFSSYSNDLGGFRFSSNLALGSRGEEVKYLQRFLNSDPDTKVAYTGYGSSGWETTYFGYSTRAAVIRFQNKYANEILYPIGRTRGTGFWGFLSIAKANQLLAEDFSPTESQPQSESVQAVNGQCGFSNGQNLTSMPSAGLCYSGNSSAVTGSGPWYWTCQGYNGGASVSCYANYGQSQYNTSGALSISLSYDNPGATTLVAGQANADLAHFTFTNGSNTEARITAIEFRRLGISGDSVLKNVYLFDGNTRITDSGSVSSGIVSFNNFYGVFTVPAGGSKTIAVKSDINTGASGQTVGISLNSLNTNVQLSAFFPLSGSINTIATATLASVSITNVQPSGSPTADSGSGVRVWESTFNVNNKDVRLTRLSLKQISSINSGDVRNFRLLVDGNEVARTDMLTYDNYATFTLDRILNTGTRNVKVLADVYGGSSRSIQLSLRNSADIDIKDNDYGVFVAPSGLPATAGAILINVGQFTITPQNSYLPNSIAKGGNNVLLGRFNFRATGEAIRVDSLKFGFSTNNLNVNSLRNGRVMINGSQAGSTTTIVKGGTTYYTNYTFQAGSDTVVEFYADITEDTGAVSGDTTNDISSGDTFSIQMLTQTGNATRQTSYNVIDVPASIQYCASVSVSQANLTVFKKSNYGNQATVLPVNNFKIGSWYAVSGTAESINVNNLSFTISSVSGSTFTNADLSDMYVIYSLDSGTSITSSIKPTVNTTNDYSISFTIPTSRTLSIDLYANLNGTVSTGDSMKASLVINGTGSQSGTSMNTLSVDGQIISNNIPSLEVSRDASTAIAGLADDYGNVKTVAYKFESQNDTYTISQLTFTIADPSVVSSVVLKDGDNIIQTMPASTNVVFNLSSSVYVYSNNAKVLTVELVLANVGSGAGNSGAEITTNISLAGCLVRSSSGTSITPTGTPLSGNTIYVYKAIPTISLVSLPTSTLTAGTQILSKFAISTNGTGTIAWKKMQFNVAKTSGAGKAAVTNAELWVDGNTKVEGVATINSLGDTDSSGNIVFVANGEQQISGQRTYELRVTITSTGGISSGDYINTNIPNGVGSYAIPASYSSVASTMASFVWSDASAQGHSENTNDWNSDYLVRYLSTSTQNLSR
ncbi:MAG: peptidoglycan-binding protein [Candidatus Paceibacterota bacterium]